MVGGVAGVVAGPGGVVGGVAGFVTAGVVRADVIVDAGFGVGAFGGVAFGEGAFGDGAFGEGVFDAMAGVVRATVFRAIACPRSGVASACSSTWAAVSKTAGAPIVGRLLAAEPGAVIAFDGCPVFIPT